MPVPTEFVNKKKDRKKFKQGRKDWMKNMHRSAPDVDWEEMDRNFRRERTTQINETRVELYRNGWNDMEPYIETVTEREISGI